MSDLIKESWARPTAAPDYGQYVHKIETPRRSHVEMGEAVPCSTRLCKGNITRIIDELECQEKIRSLLLSETAFIPSIERRLSRYIWEKIMWCQYTRYK